MADDDGRKDEGLAVGAFLTGIIAQSVVAARREALLKVTVIGAIPDGDGWLIDAKTDAGFAFTVRVDLTDW